MGQTSYWGAVAVVGARQLLATIPSAARWGAFTRQTVEANALHGCRGDKGWSQAWSTYQDTQLKTPCTPRTLRLPLLPPNEPGALDTPGDLDDDDGDATTISIASTSDNYNLDESAYSDSEYSATDSSHGSLKLAHTRGDASVAHLDDLPRDLLFEPGHPVVKLPTCSRPTLPHQQRQDLFDTRMSQELSVSTVKVYQEDHTRRHMSNTAALRLPGMRSRLEITKITWIREVPISPSTRFGEGDDAASVSASCRSEASSVSVPDPLCQCDQPHDETSSPPSLDSATFVRGRPSGGMQTSTTVPALEGVAAAAPARSRPSAQMGEPPQRQHPGSALPCALLSIDRADRVTAAPPSTPLVVPLSPAERRALNPASMPADPPASPRDIPNGPFVDTPANEHIPAALHTGDVAFSCLSALDPPVCRPKPIGTTRVVSAEWRRSRRAAACAGIPPPSRVAADAVSETGAGDSVDPALPWPPVLLSPSGPSRG